MTTHSGRIGGTLARYLARGGERVLLAAQDESHAEALANELGPLARASSVRDAIANAETVVFAVWLDTTTQLIANNADLLKGKVVVDPSNPAQPDGKGGFRRLVPEGQSAGSAVANLLPPEAH